MSEETNQDTILNLQGSYQDFDKILTLFLSGDLEERLGVQISDVSAIAQHQPTALRSVSINLNQWFQQSLVDGWEYETILLGLFLSQQMNPVFGNRTTTETIAQTPVSELADLLQSEHQEVRFRAAVELAERQKASPEIITALVDAIQTSNAITAWQIALSLGRIVSGHPQAAIAKRQEMIVGNLRLELLVALRRSKLDSIDILLQLYSIEEHFLPIELQLTVLDELGEITSQQKTGAQTPYLSLQLSGSQGQEFVVQIAWNEHCIDHYFVV